MPTTPVGDAVHNGAVEPAATETLVSTVVGVALRTFAKPTNNRNESFFKRDMVVMGKFLNCRISAAWMGLEKVKARPRSTAERLWRVLGRRYLKPMNESAVQNRSLVGLAVFGEEVVVPERCK